MTTKNVFTALRQKKVHKFYLRITAIIIGSFGPVFFFGTMPATSAPAAWSMDFLSWPLDGQQNFLNPTTRFLSALTGGFLLGWGVTIWYLATKVYDKAPEPVRQVVLRGLLSWFVLDSAGSVASGHSSNAFFNVIVLFLAVGPLWKPAKE